MRRWFAVETHVRGERKALAHLRRQGFRAYLPQYLKRRSHARRVEQVPAPLFPRYLFVQIDPAHEPWRAINSTVGVSRLLSFGKGPTPVPDKVVDTLRAKENERGYVPVDDGLKPGQSVRFLEGPLSDCEGLFQCVDDEKRVFVLLELLGRTVTVCVPSDAVSAAS